MGTLRSEMEKLGAALEPFRARTQETHTECPRGKRYHATPESAEQQRQSLLTRRQVPGEWCRPYELVVYACRACGGYHVGNAGRGEVAQPVQKEGV